MENNWQAFLDSIEHLTGFVIVMIALGGLWGLTVLMAKLIAAIDKPKAQAQAQVAASAAAVAAAPAVAHAGPPEDDLVVVAAAVASMLGVRHRVVAVRPIASSWGQQGRRDIHASHRIR